MIGFRGEPLVCPDVDQRTITNPPTAPLNDKLSPTSNASPSIGRVTRNSSFKKGCVGKILGFVNLIEQRVLIIKEPLALFSE